MDAVTRMQNAPLAMCRTTFSTALPNSRSTKMPVAKTTTGQTTCATRLPCGRSHLCPRPERTWPTRRRRRSGTCASL
jgi:hypothetical protein